MSDPVVLLSTGDVVGPAGGVTDNSMVLFNGTSGKLIKGNNAVVTAAGLALLDDVDAAAQRVTLGLGTAATANVTTGATDTTAGRIMKVGDFGYGTGVSPATSLINTNLDLVNISGIYRITGVETNTPVPPLGGHVLEVLVWNDGTFYQNYYTQNGQRRFTRSIGQAWREIWTTNNLVKQTSRYDATAGSVLTVGAFGLGGDAVAVTDLNTALPSGFYQTASPYTNAPAAGLFSVHHINIDANNATQFASQPNIYGIAIMYAREKNAGTWGGWTSITTNLTAFAAGAQTWQNVAGSRAINTTYTNSTGRPIFVIINMTDPSNSATNILLDGVSMGGVDMGVTGKQQIGFPVQHNGTYQLVGPTGITAWLELR